MNLRLLLKNLTRQPLRTALTMFGVAASIFIFVTLLSLDRGTRAMVEQSSNASIVTVFEKYKACPPYSKLPVSYADKISEIPHVVGVMPEKFLLSNCKTTTDLIAIHGVEADKLRQFREIEIPEAQYAEFAQERGAAIIGRKVADKYGWTPGDQVTLQQLGGVSFTVRGVYDAEGSHDNLILVDREYLELSTNQVGWVTLFNVLVDDERNVNQVATAIDTTFANFQARTNSGPEDSFVLGMIQDFSDMVRFVQIVAYMALILLLAAVANSVSMSVRERMREMAILKLVGFRSERVARLMLAEALTVSVLGALVGVGLAAIVLTVGGFHISVEGFTITPTITSEVVLYALLAGAVLGYAGAYIPTVGGSRRPIIGAMREVD